MMRGVQRVCWEGARLLLLAGVATAAVLAPTLASGSAMAQEVRDLDRATSDVQIFEGVVSTTPAVFRYTIPPNTVLQVDVIPKGDSELDPVLTITDLATGEVLAEDDDGGGGVASRARIVTQERRRVEITVSAFAFFSGEETTGPFELQLRPAPYVPEPTTPVTLGSDTSGRVASGGQRLYTIQGRKGQVLEVALVAADNDFDPMLTLYRGRGTLGEELASNDDNGYGLNSYVRVILPADDTYTIAASGYGESEGQFTLRVAPERDSEITQGEQVLDFGERLSGNLPIAAGVPAEHDDTVNYTPAETQHVIYRLSPQAIAAIRAGSGEVTFNMTAPLFQDPDFPSQVDPYLELGFETPLGFAVVVSDDDGGENMNARIAVDLGPLAREGDWLERLRLRAMSVSDGGPYDIEMVSGMQELFPDDYAYPGEVAEALEDAAAE